MKTFFKLLPSLIIPLLLVFTFVLGYKGLEEKTIVIKQIPKATINVDHSQFEQLKTPFDNPWEMTEACLSCHNKRAEEIMKTAHWQWSSTDTLANGKVTHRGKKNVLNNFCVGVNSNEALCSSCHIGFGYDDHDFDFADQNNIDCIICHDNTGRYKKAKGNGGLTSAKVDLNQVAQHVGPTSNRTCSQCHAKGGGGNNVKHGDLDMDMCDKDICTPQVDVHMSQAGANLNCSQCHITEHHQIKGSGPMTNTFKKKDHDSRATCTECHSSKPHNKPLLNEHFNKVSCQTCHIPRYAKINKTTIYWDWSTTGLRDGKKYKEISEDGMKKMDSGHGTAIYGKNLTPEYYWWNGIADQTTLETKITTDTVDMNALHGDYINTDSKIYPFKVMRGKQPFDTKNNTFVQMKTFGPKGSDAYWSDFDWNKSIRNGMEYTGYPYSGHYGFIETRSYWPLNHMVSPANEALSCIECHSSNSVLNGLDDFYLPGRDVNRILDWAGKLFIIFSILGVSIHSVLRIMARKRNPKIN